jgi:hypothetical protein
MEDLLDVSRGLASPIGTNNHVITWTGASGPATDVAVIKSIGVGELNRIVARLRNRGNGDHGRFGAQVQLHHGIGSVAIRSDDRRILGSEHPSFVEELADRRLVLRRSWIHKQLVR